MPTVPFSSSNDNLNGGGGDDVFVGSVNQITATDIVSGGGGFDTVQVTSAGAQFDGSRMTGMTSIEALDFTGGGALTVVLYDYNLNQSSTHQLTVSYGASSVNLNVSSVGSAGDVLLNGTGLVTLRDLPGQRVTVVNGVSGNVQGGTMDDVITGGTGADTLKGGDGNDRINGGTGANTLDGGAGHDFITLGGTGVATGGAGSDTFALVPGAGAIRITDFNVADPMERIDLRAIAGATGFGALTISTVGGKATVSVGGATLTLDGVTAGQLTADNFIFAGQTDFVSTAQIASATPVYVLDLGDDNAMGTAGADVFSVAGNIARLAGTDIINGGAGVDTLRITNGNLSLGASSLTGLNSVERIDISTSAATSGQISVALEAAQVIQAGGLLTLYAGTNNLLLDVADVGSAGVVSVATFGQVTLRNFVGEAVTIHDSVNGNVLGGSQDDVVRGGAGRDTIDGAGSDDNLYGNGGNDTLIGGDGNDYLDGGAGVDSLNGGAGYDVLVMGQTDTASGGVGSTDVFVIGADATSVTITDFEVNDHLERIDLRAVAAATGFDELTITDVAGGKARVVVGGVTITLNGVTASQLNANDFVFAGQNDVITVASVQAADPTFILTPGNDVFNGGAGNDLIELVGDINRLSGTDAVHGGAGVDTLRITNTSLSLDASRLAGLDSIERISVTSSSNGGAPISVSLDAAVVAQAGGNLTLVGGINDLLLDVSDVGAAGTVSVATYGTVTLRNFDGQSIRISDSVDGVVQGGTGADVVVGGIGNDTISGATGADRLSGGAGDDTLNGDDQNDVLSGGSGRDTLNGGAGDDQLTGGSGNDVMNGGAGRDTIYSDGGNDTVSGGTSTDTYVISGSGTTTITDFSVANIAERVDLRAYAGVTSLADLTITDTPNGASFTVGTHTVVLQNVTASQLTAGEFIFSGQTDINTFFVPDGTTQARLQQVIDEAPEGAVIQLGAGEFEINSTLFVRRGDITIRGMGSDQTTLVSLINDANASETISVESPDLRIKVADIAVTGNVGDTTLRLTSTEGLSVGSILYIGERNTDAYFAATGNTGLQLPDDYADNPDLYALREQLVRVVAIDNATHTVTLSDPLAYQFDAGQAWAGLDNPLRNVHLEGFQIVTTFPDVDPDIFTNTRDAWFSIATVTFDTVTDSSLSDIQIHNPGSHGFRFQRVYGLTGDNLLVEGAMNKGPDSNGYAYFFNEAFGNVFTHLRDEDMRHSVLFSSFSAEAWNHIQVDWTNRDINFHGSADNHNTIIVTRMESEYGDAEQWQAVGPGHFPIHPQSTVEDNTVLFGYLRSGDLDEVIHALDTGSDIGSGGGDDIVYGGAGIDMLLGQDGDDYLYGAAGADDLNGGDGDDLLNGQAGADSMAGGMGQDILRGDGDGDSADQMSGGDGFDLIYLGSRDTATGGSGADTFVVIGTTTMTITDFSVTNTLERIDLRAIAAATGMNKLTLTQTADGARIDVGGARIILTGVNVADLSAANFVFAGQSDFITLAQSQVQHANYFISSQADTITGTAFADVIMGSGNALTAADAINGGAGVDTLRIIGGGITAAGLGALTSVERIDVALSDSPVSIVVDAAATDQSSTDKLTIIGGSNDITLDSRGAQTANVIVETTGVITLRNFEGEVVTVSNNVSGRVVGGSGGDKIAGGALADDLRGGLGNDSISGGAGDDVIEGGAGNDTLTGGAGRDKFIRGFGEGSDTITDFTSGADGDTLVLRGYAAQNFGQLVLRQSGADTIVDFGQDGQILLKNVTASTLTAANFLFQADGTTRTFTATTPGGLIMGSDGDDVITLPSGNVASGLTIVGGAGVNTVRIGANNYTLNASAASFSQWSNVGVLDFSGLNSMNVTFGQAILAQAPGQALTLLIGNAISTLDIGTPLDGARLIVQGLGQVTLAGGRDQIVYASDLVGGRINGGAARDTIFGGALGDTLGGGAGTDTLVGNAGNDTLDGGAGVDTMAGGTGDDTYVVDNAADVVTELAGEGTDTVQSLISLTIPVNVEILQLLAGDINGKGRDGTNDIIRGGDGNNIIQGLGGNDWLIGGAGNDTLDGGLGADRMEGGLGDDTYGVENLGDLIIEAADGGIDTVKTNISGFVLTTNVEILTMTGTGDLMGTGNDGNNILQGTTGNNNLLGGKGDDQLYGGAGNDILNGGTGADRLYGGTGDDIYYYGVGDTIIEAENSGIDTVYASVNFTIGYTLEHLRLIGDRAINGTGNNLNNEMTGNEQANVFQGGGGNDTLSGMGGADTLIGGAGADVLIGGAGADIFRIDQIAHSTVAAADHITDYSVAQGDKLDLSRIDANTLAAGDQAFALVNAFTHHAGELTLSYDAGANQTTLNVDVNGDGLSDMAVLFDGQVTSTAGWLL